MTTYTGLGLSPAYRGMPSGQYDCYWLGIVVIINAKEAIGGRPMECLNGLHRARVIGLVEQNATPSPLERDLLACRFGFAELTIL